MFPVTLKGVIEEYIRKITTFNEQFHGGLDFIHIFTAFFNSLQVPFELPGIFDLAHLNAELIK